MNRDGAINPARDDASQSEAIRRLLLNVRLLQETARSSKALSKHGVLEDRREAVALRRMIATHIADIAAAARELMIPDQRRQVLNATSKVRAVIAHHQAAWPIVAVSLDDPGYQQSVASVRTACSVYFQWIADQKFLSAP